MSDIGLFSQTACLWEATARKAGNVHRYADFADLTYLDFALSAAAIAPVLATAQERRLGATVRDCVMATRRVVASNSNLGMILLLAPLASVPEGVDLCAGVAAVLAKTDVEDARLVYEAIRLANPGGLGAVAAQDVAAPPTLPLVEVMRLAAGRDRVARQYSTAFADVFDEAAPALCMGLAETGSLEGAILWAQLHLLAQLPDSLIAQVRPRRRRGSSTARRHVLTEGWPKERAGWQAYGDLDAWLRADGHRRNPGTTADLLTAVLFVLLRQGTLSLPSSYPWADHAMEVNFSGLTHFSAWPGR